MPPVTAAFTVLVAMGLAAWLSRRFCDPSSRFHILDRPNERSLHKNPTPRSGGLAILAGLLAGTGLSVLAGDPMLPAWLLAALAPVAAVSYLDDRAGVPVMARLVAHMTGAGLLLWGGDFAFRTFLSAFVDGSWHPWLGMMLVILYVTWMINLYNFMDGMDGLAAGMAVIGFSCYAIMGWLSGNWQFAQSSLVVAAASAGFLFFNFPPARIFMGDVGSSTLGLLAAAFSLWGVRDGVFPFWAAILIFSPFIADASVTLVRRMIRGEKIWQAHKTHYYQKLAQAGWGHRKTALTEYAIMVGCGVTALSSQHATVILQMILLAGWVLFYVIFFPWVSWYSARRCHGPL
jgi:UDP-N-acetylmuramyl pentapeptide phosphotransferase/UDP-N-acetylglucosamine-1-phosphate transferase